MLVAFLASATVVAALIAVALIAVVHLQQVVGKNIRGKTLALVAAYDNLLEQKSAELARLARQAKALEAVQAPPPETMAELAAAPAANTAQTVTMLAQTQYRDSGVAQAYHAIRDGFTVRTAEIPAALLKHSKAGSATQLIENLPFETCYALASLDGATQLSVLRDTLPQELRTLLEGYASGKAEFDVTRFWEEMKFRALHEEADPVVYAAPFADVSGIPSDVKIVRDETLCEGVQVLSGGTPHDYAITVREIS